MSHCAEDWDALCEHGDPAEVARYADECWWDAVARATDMTPGQRWYHLLLCLADQVESAWEAWQDVREA